MASLALLPEQQAPRKKQSNKQPTTNNFPKCCLLMLVTFRCWYTTAASLRRDNNQLQANKRTSKQWEKNKKQRNQNVSREYENVAVWRFGRKPQSYHEEGRAHSKNARGQELLEEAVRAVQLGTSWQDESPYKEELLRSGSDMRLDGTMI